MRKFLRAALVAAAFLPACAAQQIAADRPLPDGLYVVRVHSHTKNIFVVATSAPAADDSAQVAIDVTQFVPLQLRDAVIDKIGADGRARVTATSGNSAALEKFTREYLGARIAIVVDRHVISTHKIRSVIQNGEIQITRCGANANEKCSVIRTKLNETL